jgi:exopolyphosphatase/pppGpp-phosphohydrolase
MPRPDAAPERRGGALAIVVALLLAACAQQPAVHLVIDAGSTGTRFCPFAVERSRDACDIAAAPKPLNACQPVSAPNGLADLGPEAAVRVLERGFAAMDPDLRERVREVALLGTGGFRAKPATDQRAVMQAAEQFFATKGVRAKASVLSGEDEGRLAWLTIRSLTGSRAHTILETGGATVQLATGVDARIRAVSAPVGMTVTLRELRSDPRIERCYAPNATSRTTSASACAALIGERIFGPSSIATAGLSGTGPTYGMGLAWESVFTYAGKNEITRSELEALAAKYCAMTPEEIVRSGVKPEFADRACYLLAYHVAQVAAPGFIETIRRGSESWPRGAAVSGEYFEGCGG